MINKYLDSDMFFSALQIFTRISNTLSVYQTLQYADTLRLAGLFSKSEEVFFRIKEEEIPEKYIYLYYLYFAKLYIDKGELAKAKLKLFKILDLRHNDTVPYIYLAAVLKSSDEPNDAIRYLKDALDKEGDLDEVYYNLATSYCTIGDFYQALKAIDECLIIDENYPNAATIKADILETLKLSTETNSMLP